MQAFGEGRLLFSGTVKTGIGRTPYTLGKRGTWLLVTAGED